ncbi:MAG: hypothetical protein GY714_25020 [Desulfobacterales bacterium]|nr:hypothetical protein [Desulfobacterales bacterium]MCP4162077.1 hypothetical protein [Deltaproteobacteria bacterium]
MKIRTFLIFFVLCLAFVFPNNVMAIDKKELPKELSPALSYLISISDDQSSKGFDPAKVSQIIDFILKDKKKQIYFSKLIKKRSSAYSDYTIETDLKTFIGYLFNPDIPSAFAAPISIRLSWWKPLNKSFNLVDLSSRFDSLTEPVIVKGTEHTETTPDDSTGGYYNYDLKNSCFLFKYKDRKVLISLNKQIKKSTVGYKGYPFGPKKEPYNIYSDDDGLTTFGLGWVSSYVYDSLSISVYISDGKSIKCGAFNWMNAGWAGNNMAKKKHVYNGIHKYGNALRTILENKSLPSSETLKKSLKKLDEIPKIRLLELAKNFHTKAEKKFSNFPDDEYEDDVKLDKFSREQLAAIIFTEYIRIMLGKETVFTKKDIPFMF